MAAPSYVKVCVGQGGFATADSVPYHVAVTSSPAKVKVKRVGDGSACRRSMAAGAASARAGRRGRMKDNIASDNTR